MVFIEDVVCFLLTSMNKTVNLWKRRLVFRMVKCIFYGVIAREWKNWKQVQVGVSLTPVGVSMPFPICVVGSCVEDTNEVSGSE